MSDHFAFDRKKMHKALHDEISTYENIISAIVFLLDSVSIAMIFFTPFMVIFRRGLPKIFFYYF